MGIQNVLNRWEPSEQNLMGNDDIRILHSYAEYDGPDRKRLNYMIYELNMMDSTGELRHFYKALKFMRVIRLPKDAKQSLAFMQMHDQVLAGLWERGINFVTLIANMIKPVPLGLLYVYGIQGVAEDLDTAKRIAEQDYIALTSMLSGTYRTLEYRPLEQQETEWLREKMYSMKNLSAVRGLPQPREGGVDVGSKGFGGGDLNPYSQDTTEEFIAGMSDKEYVVEILTTPIAQKALQKWQTQTSKEMTRWYSQLQGNKAISAGINVPMMYGANLGSNSGWSHSYSDGQSVGSAHSLGTSDSFSTSVSDSHGIGQSAGISHSDGESASLSKGHSEGTSYGFSYGENVGKSHSQGISDSYSFGQSHGTSQSVGDSQNVSNSQSVSRSQGDSTGFNSGTSSGGSHNNGRSMDTSDSLGMGASASTGVSMGVKADVSGSFNTNHGMGRGASEGNATQYGDSAQSSGGTSKGLADSFGTTAGSGLSKSQGTSDGMSIGSSRGSSESWGDSYGQSRGQNWGASTSDSVSISRGTSSSDGWSKGISQSDSISRSYGRTTGTSEGTTESWGRNQGESLGSSGGFSQGTSASLGAGVSLSLSKSFQWLDQEVQNILELLEFQNQRLKKALKGNGGFFVDVYIATQTELELAAAQALAKSVWFNEEALVAPLQVMDLSREEQDHLLYHFNAFSPDTSKEGIPGKISSYRYSTVLLPEELVAYTHLPRISEGGIFADVQDIPKLSVPSMRKGEIFLGKILSGERWTQTTGYVTPFDFRLASEELMHGIFTGESRSGKTVAATRFIAELANKVRRESGKRMRIVVMDPKQDWRVLSKFIEPERFHFYSLANPEFLPINLNICKVPHNVYPQQWIDGLIEIYCRAYGLGERGKAVLSETMYMLYEEAGVFVPNWREVAPERSSKVTLPRIFERMMKIKVDLEDPTKSGKGRVGNDVRDAYARVLDRLQVFGRPFSIEAQLFGRDDGVGIDDLIGQDDVVVLESYGLESTFKNFVFGMITSGFFKYAIAHEGGFKAADQYETVLVIEEANEVLLGQDTPSKSGGSPLPGTSEFEKILDQAAGLGLFIFSITQKIADMPSSVIANSGLLFAGKISRVMDVEVVIRKIGREERIDDRDLVKWFPRSPIGWFVCRSSRNFDFKEVEPVLVKIAPLDVKPPTNDELLHIMALKAAKAKQTA